jgi:hypothetical protein
MPNAVIALSVANATLTVTVYAWVVASAAVTVYITGPLKFSAVPEAGLIDAPVWVMDVTILVTGVP